MTYSPITPQSQPSPAATQAQIQTNFAQYALKFLVNHSALNTKNQGDHESVVLEKQASDPGVLQDKVNLYCKDAVANSGTEPQLFAQIMKFLPTSTDGTDAPNIGMQLTQSTVDTVGPNQFQSFLPGGYLLHFGTVTATGAVTLVPGGTQILTALAIPNNMTTSGTPTPFSISTAITASNTFNINSNATGVFSITWLAISRA
jgi:hypothetical protein